MKPSCMLLCVALMRSAGGNALVDRDAGAVIATPGVGREQHDHVGHVIDFDQTAHAGVAFDQRVIDTFRHLQIGGDIGVHAAGRSEEHTSELQSLMRISYAVFCLKKKKNNKTDSANYTKNM